VKGNSVSKFFKLIVVKLINNCADRAPRCS